jgi:hypothetical protein
MSGKDKRNRKPRSANAGSTKFSLLEGRVIALLAARSWRSSIEHASSVIALHLRCALAQRAAASSKLTRLGPLGRFFSALRINTTAGHSRHTLRAAHGERAFDRRTQAWIPRFQLEQLGLGVGAFLCLPDAERDPRRALSSR